MGRGLTGLPAIYVASPLGFTEPTRAFYGDVLLRSVRDRGLVPLDPWTAPFDDMAVALSEEDVAARVGLLAAANHRHGAHNAQLIRDAAAVLAVLDGPDVDSGTAAEVGFAAALGRPVVGWRSDLRASGDNEATVVNLQVEYFIKVSGGAVFRQLDAAVDALAELVRDTSENETPDS